MASALMLALFFAVLCGSGLAGRPMSQEEYGCTELLHGFDKLKCWGNEIVATVPTLIDVPPALCDGESLVMDGHLEDCEPIAVAVGERAFLLAMEQLTADKNRDHKRKECSSVICTTESLAVSDRDLLGAGAAALGACDGSLCLSGCVHGVMVAFVKEAKELSRGGKGAIQDLIFAICEKHVGGQRLVPTVSVDACGYGAGVGFVQASLATLEEANELCSLGEMATACRRGVIEEYVLGHMRSMKLDATFEVGPVATLCDRFRDDNLKWLSNDEKRCLEALGKGIMFLMRPNVMQAERMCKQLKNPVNGLTCVEGAKEEHRHFSNVERVLFRERCMRYRELAARENRGDRLGSGGEEGKDE